MRHCYDNPSTKQFLSRSSSSPSGHLALHVKTSINDCTANPSCLTSPSHSGNSQEYNTDESIEPLACRLARLLAPLTRSLAPPCSHHSRTPLRSLVCLLAHLAQCLARGTVNDWMAIFSVFFFYFGPQCPHSPSFPSSLNLFFPSVSSRSPRTPKCFGERCPFLIPTAICTKSLAFWMRITLRRVTRKPKRPWQLP